MNLLPKSILYFVYYFLALKAPLTIISKHLKVAFLLF